MIILHINQFLVCDVIPHISVFLNIPENITISLCLKSDEVVWGQCLHYRFRQRNRCNPCGLSNWITSFSSKHFSLVLLNSFSFIILVVTTLYRFYHCHVMRCVFLSSTSLSYAVYFLEKKKKVFSRLFTDLYPNVIPIRSNMFSYPNFTPG